MSSKLEQLHLAVVSGDVATTKSLLCAGNANYRDPKEGLTLLGWAVACGQVSVAAALLDAGAKRHVPDRHGFTPLHRAAAEGKHSMVELLLTHPGGIAAVGGGVGVDVNVPSSPGRRTPLILASIRGDAAMVALLWRHGADVDARDADGMSALDHATYRGFNAVVSLLIGHGAECNAARYYCEEGIKHVATVPQRDSFESIVKDLCAPWAPQSLVTMA